MRVFLVGLLFAACGAQAALQPRDLDSAAAGFEAVYDSDRNITWLADPHASGMLSWTESAAFAGGLSVGAHTGWRLARGSELVNLWQDWQTASIAEFGADFFFDETKSADAGMGSTLFTAFPMGEVWDLDADADYAFVWVFDRLWTDQGPTDKDSYRAYGWAVHDGDLAPSAVPEPTTYALMLAGLLAVGLAAHRKSKPCR